jgi:3-dehydroquinate synthetase
VLNAGHTIGHAIERASGYSVSHGHAVAVGLVAEALVACRIGVMGAGDARRVREAIVAMGLPERLPPGVTPAGVVDATRADKKRRGDEVRYSLLAAVGRPACDEAGAFTRAVPVEVVRDALEELA